MPAVFNSDFTINPTTFSNRLTFAAHFYQPRNCLSLGAAVQASNSSSHTVLPSYTALKPCALTAKSVVNHKANIDPLLTIGDGSMNPDNLKDTKKKEKKCFHMEQQQKRNISDVQHLLFTYAWTQEARVLTRLQQHEVETKHYKNHHLPKKTVIQTCRGARVGAHLD